MTTFLSFFHDLDVQTLPPQQPEAASPCAVVAPPLPPVAPPRVAQPDAPWTLGALLTLYEREYLPHQAMSTQRQKTQLFRDARRDFGHVLLADVTPALLRDWRDRLARRLAPASVNRYMLILSSALHVAVHDYELLPKNPMRQVKRPAIPPERVRFLSEDEQARLLAACQRSRTKLLYPLVLLALTTGVRKNEGLTLKWSDLDLDMGFIRLQSSKTGIRHSVPVPQKTVVVLREWRETQYPPSPYVFGSRSGLKPASITNGWYLALARAQVEDFRFHDLRHSAASYLAMAGVRLEVIADILGHRSITTTRRYAHLSPSYTHEQLEKMADKFIHVPAPHGVPPVE